MRRGVFSGLLMAAVSVGAILEGSASASAIDPRQDWVVDAATATVKNVATGACLTGTGPGRPTIMQSCTSGPAQRFSVFVPAIVNRISGLCLTGTGPSNWTIMQSCTGAPAQQFAVQGRAIRNQISGLCLTATGPTTPTVMEACRV